MKTLILTALILAGCGAAPTTVIPSVAPTATATPGVGSTVGQLYCETVAGQQVACPNPTPLSNPVNCSFNPNLSCLVIP